MLTADLVKVRRHRGELRIVQLSGKARANALAVAEALLAVASEHVGRSRERFFAACAGLDIAPSERKLADGLRKLIEDRCDFGGQSELDPVELRRAVFLRASEVRQSLGPAERFDRFAVLSEVAGARGLAAEAVERVLYADLRGAQLLQRIDPIGAEALVDLYDLAQAQAVLLRAVRVRARVQSASPGIYRALFRKLKFLRLLCTINPDPDGEGYRLEIDGPFSLFESVSKYGLQLALALPALRACDAWALEADIRWGKTREPLVFRLTGEGHGPVDALDAEAALPDEVAALLRAVRTIDTPWRAAPADAILTLPGVGLCVADLVFEHAVDGRKVYLEVMGYWSRAAVWRRVELVEQGLGARIVFAVSERLRVSEEVLDATLPAALYVFKGALSPRAVLARVEQLGAR